MIDSNRKSEMETSQKPKRKQALFNEQDQPGISYREIMTKALKLLSTLIIVEVCVLKELFQ